MSVTILGIESSCDDTSSSVIRDGVMLSNVIASQAVHEAYGGVVPELASRAHQQNIIPEEQIPIAHHWLILHGRYTCIARKPKCEECGLKPWCKYFLSPKKT